MNKLVNIASISCKEAALLGTKKSLDSLSFIEGIKFKLHLKICKTCEDYINQNNLLDSAIEQLLKSKKQQIISLTEEQRTKIIQVLKH